MHFSKGALLFRAFFALGRMKGQHGFVLVQVFQLQHNRDARFNILRVAGVYAQQEGADARPFLQRDHPATVGIITAVSLLPHSHRHYGNASEGAQLSPEGTTETLPTVSG